MSAVRLALVTALVAAGVAVQARQSSQAFRSNADGVRVDVRVTRGGASIEGLTAGDFELLDNGVVQHVDSAQTTGFVSAALVVDNSDSVTSTQLASLLTAGRTLLDALRAPDTISLLTVNDRISMPLEARSSLAEVRRALDGVSRQPTSRTPLWDAIAAGASIIADDAGARVVVVASDGGDNESWLTRDAVERALTRSGIVLDWIATNFAYRSVSRSPDEKYGEVIAPMNQLVARAGGVVFQVGSADLAAALAQHLRDLRSSYVLTYTPTGVAHDDGWHKLEVKLKGRKGDVRARPGYYATPK